MAETKTMKEKVALVTGAGMGIGLACAEAFARAGYITVLSDINEPKVQAERLVAEGYKATAYRLDVSDTQAVKEMIDWIIATYGRLGKPEEIADAVLWLCSPQATYMNGHGLIVDGSITIK